MPIYVSDSLISSVVDLSFLCIATYVWPIGLCNAQENIFATVNHNVTDLSTHCADVTSTL
jgi:hypothetical protein